MDALSTVAPSSNSANTREIAAQQNRLFYRTPMGLWVTDGTASGTLQILFQNNSISDIEGLVPVGSNRMLFARLQGSRPSEVWATDGTSQGTQRLSTGVLQSDLTKCFTSPQTVVLCFGRSEMQQVAFGQLTGQRQEPVRSFCREVEQFAG